MPLHRALPLYVLLLAACSAPNEGPATAEMDPGPDCRGECAAGYKWAMEKGLSDAIKCRGESEYARGCRMAVNFNNPFET